MNNTISTQSLQRWGNSAGVRIPKKVIERAQLKINDELMLSIKGRSIVLTPIKRQDSFKLKDMLKGVTPADVGGEYVWDPPVGKEIW